MRRIDLKLVDKGDWVKVFDPRDSTIFVAAEDPAHVGEQIRIDLLVGSGGPRVILRGKVIARRMKGDVSLPRGMNIALGPEEREKINYMNGFVRGGLLNLREMRRLPLRFPVTYGGIGGPIKTHTRDINEEGVFVITEDPLPEGSEVHILLTVPTRSSPVSLAGLVAHTVVVEDEDVPGMGIRFRFQGNQREDMVGLIDELERMFLENALDEEHLL
ncbi:MAG TPA: PilZ domain-containing protein [Candidatus Acidoferrum sp.]|nr:PilZ domain-containing protein [Candidatus Acidoferrum sp.]